MGVKAPKMEETVPVSDPGAEKPRGRRFGGGKARGGPRRVPWGLAIPGIAFAFFIHLLPTFFGAWYAFTDWNGLSASANWVGLDNFRGIFDDPTTKDALIHTVVLAATFLVFANVFGLALALGLNRAVKSRNLLRSIFFAPVVVSSLAVGYIFQFIFDFNGPLNKLLGVIGLEEWQRPWLGDPTWALWTILVVLVWQYSGLTMVLYLAGLQSIPQELEEAAAVDGASLWTRFRRITLPLLAPAFTVSLTLTLIIGLRVFDQVLSLTGGGPVDSTQTLATQVWEQTWVNGRFGYGAAFALILVVLVAGLAMTQSVILRRREARI